MTIRLFSFIALTCLILFGCKKNNDDDTHQYYFTVTIDGQTITDTWYQSRTSEVAMGADLDPGVVAGVERMNCDAPNFRCYRFSFDIAENKEGGQDPSSFHFDLKEGGSTHQYHYFNNLENGEMNITLDNIQPPIGETKFDVIQGKFKGNVYKEFPDPQQAVLVPIEGSFSIPTIP